MTCAVLCGVVQGHHLSRFEFGRLQRCLDLLPSVAQKRQEHQELQAAKVRRGGAGPGLVDDCAALSSTHGRRSGSGLWWRGLHQLQTRCQCDMLLLSSHGGGGGGGVQRELADALAAERRQMNLSALARPGVGSLVTYDVMDGSDATGACELSARAMCTLARYKPAHARP